jgi:hypothetical protein
VRLGRVRLREGARPDGAGVVYHYDGAAWTVAMEDFSAIGTGPGAPLAQVAGRVTGPNRSAAFAIGAIFFGDGTWDASGLAWRWFEPDFVSCEPPSDVWISQDGRARITTGMSSYATPLSYGWCDDGRDPNRIELQPDNPMPSPDEWIGECEAVLFDTITTFASWDPNGVAFQREVRAECDAVRGWRCDPNPDSDWCHEEYRLDGDADEVWAWAGAEWVPLYGARLIGTPCGALTAYASVGMELYSFDERQSRWVVSNGDWPLVQGAQFCQTTYPSLPMPACACP